jgi:hypothetical protein
MEHGFPQVGVGVEELAQAVAEVVMLVCQPALDGFLVVC